MTSKSRDTADIVDDVSVELASKLPYSYGTATPSTTDSGFLWYDSNSTPAAPKFWDGAAFQPISGKIVQIVHDTKLDSFSTTSTTPTNVTGLSATITPTSSSNYLYVMASVNGSMEDVASASSGFIRLSDGTNTSDLGTTSGNTFTSGAFPRNPTHVVVFHVGINWYYTPATTSPVTINAQLWRQTAGTAYINRGVSTGFSDYPSAASTLTIWEIAA